MIERQSIINEKPIQTTVIGSYPTPSWLDALPSTTNLRDAIMVVLKTQELAGIDLISDGELSRFNVNHPVLVQLSKVLSQGQRVNRRRWLGVASESYHAIWRARRAAAGRWRPSRNNASGGEGRLNVAQNLWRAALVQLSKEITRVS